MNIKELFFIIGWALIVIGAIGLFASSSVQVPQGAQIVDNYSYTQPLGNGQYRLTIYSQPRNSFSILLFDIGEMQSDSRRYTVNNSVPDANGEGSIYAVNKIDSGSNHCIRNGYTEFNFRTEPIESITYATLHFRAATVYNETVWLEVYACDNINHSTINWYNQPARAQSPLETFVVPAETHPDSSWESYQLDVTDVVTGEFSQDKIATFGFFAQDKSGFAYIARYNLDPFPTLTIDYTPTQTSGGGSSGSSNNTDTQDTSDNTVYIESDPLENVISGPGFHLWPIICIVIGVILVAYSSNGRFYR